MTRTPTIAAAPPHPHTPRCPRCGYDLAGVPPTWTTQCPLVGTCSECGGHLDWMLLQGPGGRMPPWFVENPNVQGPWAVLRAALRTILRSRRPVRFWSHITSEAAVSGARLLLTLALAIIVFYLASALLRIVGVLTLIIDAVNFGDHAYAAGVVRECFEWPVRMDWSGLALPLLCWPVSLGIGLLLPRRLSRPRTTKVARQLLRAFVYGTTGFGVWLLLLFATHEVCMLLDELNVIHVRYTDFPEIIFFSGAIGSLLWMIVWWAAVNTLLLRQRLWWLSTLLMIAGAMTLVVFALIFIQALY